MLRPSPSDAKRAVGPRLYASVWASWASLVTLFLIWNLLVTPPIPVPVMLAWLIGPLLLPLPGLVRRQGRSYFWLSLLGLWYVLWGSVEAYSDPHVRVWALTQCALSTALFLSSTLALRFAGGLKGVAPRTVDEQFRP